MPWHVLTLCCNKFSKISVFTYHLDSYCAHFRFRVSGNFVMKAMILAAGFGTRLFPLTIDRTKPAIPFLGKPLVGYVAEYVAKFGITEVVVNLHHLPQSVIDARGNGDDFCVTIE